MIRDARFLQAARLSCHPTMQQSRCEITKTIKIRQNLTELFERKKLVSGRFQNIVCKIRPV